MHMLKTCSIHKMLIIWASFLEAKKLLFLFILIFCVFMPNDLIKKVM